MDNYVIYHLHSSISNAVTNIDSVTKYSEYIERAKELNMTAMAFSEHGSVMAWYDKKCKIEAAGMKYIHAEEFYITERISDNNLGPPLKIRDNWHCVLIAKNWDGVREINIIRSLRLLRWRVRPFGASPPQAFCSPCSWLLRRGVWRCPHLWFPRLRAMPNR